MTNYDARRAAALLRALIEAEEQILALKAEILALEARLREREARPVSGAPSPEFAIALTIDEVAHLLRISKGCVFNLFKTGQLTRIKIGRRTLIARAEIDTYLAENKSVIRENHEGAP